jgi:endogenous inhibitor of DNA gyrase (YacG/DUF329 family)
MPRKIKCPGCGEECDYEGNPFRPFCSERCRLIDLGKWISGNYRVTSTMRDEEEDELPDKPNNAEES